MAVHILSLNMFLPSLGEMHNEFEVDYTSMAFAVSGYLIFSAVLLISLGALADGLGRRVFALLPRYLYFCFHLAVPLRPIMPYLSFFVFCKRLWLWQQSSRALCVSESAPPEQAASYLDHWAWG